MVFQQAQQLISVEGFERFLMRPENRDQHYELIHGEIIEKAMPTEKHGIVVTRFLVKLYNHLETRATDIRLGTEIRVKLPGDTHNSRQPDISYFADSTRPISGKGAVEQMPDFVVEVKSPTDTYQDLRERADYYLANGARMVVLAFPEHRRFEVLTPGSARILEADDRFEGGEMLADFSMRVGDVFPFAAADQDNEET